MTLENTPLTTLDGRDTTWGAVAGKATLVVNVASRCGFTPQYEGLQKLYETYRERGLEILGFPCNQFGLQEPGESETIQEFCSVNFGVTFPLMQKTKVNGTKAHPLFDELTKAPDASGKAGKVKWNFEKFLVTADGTVTRFRSAVEPGSDEIVSAVEDALA